MYSSSVNHSAEEEVEESFFREKVLRIHQTMTMMNTNTMGTCEMAVASWAERDHSIKIEMKMKTEESIPAVTQTDKLYAITGDLAFISLETIPYK